MPVRIWDRDLDHVQASNGPVFYTYTRGTARSENIRSMVKNLDRFAAENPGKFSYLFHVTSGAKPPSGDDRSETTAAFNRHAERLNGVAVVIEASGFSGSVLRSAVTMVFSFYRKGFELKTFEDLASAASWLAAKQNLRPEQVLTLTDNALAKLGPSSTHPPG